MFVEKEWDAWWRQEREEGNGALRGGGGGVAEALHPMPSYVLGPLISFVTHMLQKSVYSAASEPIPRHTDQPTLGESKEHGERRRNCQPNSPNATSCKHTVRDYSAFVQGTGVFLCTSVMFRHDTNVSLCYAQKLSKIPTCVSYCIQRSLSKVCKTPSKIVAGMQLISHL